MSIVLNEYEWAEQAIRNHELGKRPAETLGRVSRYYYANQYDKRELRKKLDEFLLQCDPNASTVQWSDFLDKLAKNAGKYPLARIDSIPVSRAEMEKIEALEGIQVRRLAFTLLCAAKYWDLVSPSNNHWVNTPDREIMQMANIQTSIRRQSAMFGRLERDGMIRFSKRVDNLNVQVLFMEDGEEALRIRDFRNLGYQYLRYYGSGYMECACCGMTVKRQGNAQKYCSACAAEIHTSQMINAVMRQRAGEREHKNTKC